MRTVTPIYRNISIGCRPIAINLTIDNIMETGDEYCKKWVRYLDKYGLPFNNAMVFQEEHNVWRPMTHEDILPYEEFFSYFIGTSTYCTIFLYLNHLFPLGWLFLFRLNFLIPKACSQNSDSVLR